VCECECVCVSVCGKQAMVERGSGGKIHDYKSSVSRYPSGRVVVELLLLRAGAARCGLHGARSGSVKSP